MLSHSSAENLTKHWLNTTTLEPNCEKAPCFPCHRLHMDWQDDVKHEKTGAALIKPEAVFRVAKALGAR